MESGQRGAQIERKCQSMNVHRESRTIETRPGPDKSVLNVTDTITDPHDVRSTAATSPFNLLSVATAPAAGPATACTVCHFVVRSRHLE